MACALHVRRLRAHYRLSAPVGDPGAAGARLDGVLRSALAGAVEAAVATLGIPEHEEVLVRALHVRTRLDLRGREAALSIAWGAAVAEALRVQLASGDGVVRYGSRAQALVDVLVGAATGAHDRAWAWSRLGLWDGVGDAGAGAVRALAAMPEAAPAALAALARTGLLPRLASRVEPSSWIGVAERALAASGAPAGALDAPPSGAPSEAVAAAALRVAARASFAAELLEGAVGRAAGDRVRLRRAIAALATLAVDPHGLRRDGAPLLDAVAEAFAPARGDIGAAANTSRRAPPGGVPRSPGTERRLIADRPCAPPPSSAATLDGSTGPRGPAKAIGGGAPLEVAPPCAALAGDDAPLPPDRRRGTTRAGGLLFLLDVVAELGLPDTLCAQGGPLAARPLQWALHGLALALVPVDAADAAALAFCGAPPDGEPLGADGPRATEEERTAVEAAAAAVAERARVRLGRESEPLRTVLLETCLRHAEILADPAWLEVRLSLDEIDTRVRRAGLDLDPGWLPWLGCVVRFVYA